MGSRPGSQVSPLGAFCAEGSGARSLISVRHLQTLPQADRTSMAQMTKE